MSGCTSSDRTARSWSRVGSCTIRTPLVLAASALALVLSAAPALAAATFTEDTSQAEPGTEGHQVRMSVSEEESVGRTTGVRVTAPAGFTVTGCQAGALLWGCEVVDARTVRYAGPGSPQFVDFRFTVTTPATPGPYRFTVTQSGAEEDGEVLTSRPTFTVLGELPSPEPSPSPTPTPAPSPSAAGGGSDGSGGAASGDADGADGSVDDGADTSTGEDDTAADTDEAATSTDRGSSGGSTSPTRTEGRSSGTTLEVMPGEPTEPEDLPSPDVADQPAVASPTGDGAAAPDADTVAAGQGTTPQPGTGETPWQQLVGAALLLVAGAVVAARRWDVVAQLRGLELTARLRAWRHR